MSSLEQLLGVEAEPRLLTLESDARYAAEQAMGWSDAALTVRAVRGRKTRTRQGLFNEFSAALQFPYYFGENWPAFDECLADMAWLSMQSGIVVLVYEAAQVLADESLADMKVLVRSFGDASAAYGQPVALGEWWDRLAVPQCKSPHVNTEAVLRCSARSWSANPHLPLRLLTGTRRSARARSHRARGRCRGAPETRVTPGQSSHRVRGN